MYGQLFKSDIFPLQGKSMNHNSQICFLNKYSHDNEIRKIGQKTKKIYLAKKQM